MMKFFLFICVVNLVLDIIVTFRCSYILKKYNLQLTGSSKRNIWLTFKVFVLYLIPIINLIPLVMLSAMIFCSEDFILKLYDWVKSELKNKDK